MHRHAILASLLILPIQAMAQDAGGNRFAFTLGAGIETRPGYFGSDEMRVGPDLGFTFGALSLGPFSFGDEDANAIERGFAFRGSFRYLPERSSSEYEELTGLEDVDAAVEVGGGISYSETNWDAFAVARYGVTGHESVVADLGMDLISRPTERLTIRGGPRVSLGSGAFAQTYFGVSDAEAAASAFPSYDASGGVVSSGLEAVVEYRLSDEWGLLSGLRYDRLGNDAADSPITTEDSQVSAFAGITRRFVLEF